jgi:hypothetical protein
LPSEYTTILTSFARLFTKRIWQTVQVLLMGAILTPGQRTVAAVLRIMGLEAEQHFQNYHRVLNRARQKAFIGIRFAPATTTLSRRVG